MRRYGGAGDDGFFVAALVNGNVAAGGTFQASADLGGATLTAFAGYDAWVVTATPTGDFSWARAGGGAGTEVTRGLSQRASGSVLWWSTFDGASFAVPGATVGARAPADVAVVALDL
jgi:hypothetical protein